MPEDPLPGGGHIPAGIAPTPLNNFSPRFGLAFSPSSSGHGNESETFNGGHLPLNTPKACSDAADYVSLLYQA